MTDSDDRFDQTVLSSQITANKSMSDPLTESDKIVARKNTTT